VIIAWRIATYHVPLVISWIALMKIAVGKVSPTNVSSSQSAAGNNPADDKKGDSDNKTE
jgi:hypothetical protein